MPPGQAQPDVIPEELVPADQTKGGAFVPPQGVAPTENLTPVNYVPPYGNMGVDTTRVSPASQVAKQDIAVKVSTIGFGLQNDPQAQKAMADVAQADEPLPIGHNQTISQPYIVGLMTELLELEGGETVFEVGTGSAVGGGISMFLNIARVLRRFGHQVEFVSVSGDTGSDWPDFPGRILTTTILTEGSSRKLLPVRTSGPVPKERLMEVMCFLPRIKVKPPVRMGQVIVPNIRNAGVDLVSTDELQAPKTF